MDPAAATEESPAAATKWVSTKGNPPGIIDHRTGKKQARLVGAKVNGKAYQRPIPGLFKDLEEALAAQGVALQKFNADGVEAVWPADKEQRNQRGMVCRALRCQPSLPAPHVSTCAAPELRLCMCAQGLKRTQLALARAEERAAKKTTDERDPKLPTSVPLPKDVTDVQNQHVATLLAEGAPVGTAPGAVADAVPGAAAVAAVGPSSDNDERVIGE